MLADNHGYIPKANMDEAAFTSPSCGADSRQAQEERGTGTTKHALDSRLPSDIGFR